MITSNNDIITPQRSTLLIDTTDLVEIIEQNFGPYLKQYPEGVYLFNSTNPVIVPGQTCWLERVYLRDLSAYSHLAPKHRPPEFGHEYIPVVDIKSVINQPWDVVSTKQGDLLVSHRDLKHATLAPSAAARCAAIAYDLILNEIRSSLRYMDYTRLSFERVIASHLADGYQNVSAMRDNHVAQDLINNVFELSLGMMQTVRDYATGWKFYTLKQETPTRFYLEQHGDFRIHQWQSLVKNKQWKIKP